MSRRTQITLTDFQYDLLALESKRTGASMAELVRRAVALVYGRAEGADGSALEESFGAWSDRELDGAAYVERLRRGMGRRLA